MIDLELAALLQSLDVCHEWNGQKHVSLEHESSRAVVHGSVDCSPNCVSCGGDCVFNQLIQVIDLCSMWSIEEGSEAVLHGLMESFIDCVGLRFLTVVGTS